MLLSTLFFRRQSMPGEYYGMLIRNCLMAFYGYNNSTSMRVGSIESLTDLAQSYVGYAGADKLYYPGTL